MDFISGKELQDICEKENKKISEVMREREMSLGDLTDSEMDERLQTILDIMRKAAHDPIDNPKKSMGGLLGGEAKKLYEFGKSDKSIAGGLLSKALTYASAVLEVNATMGLIVAAPTAGSSGVLPGALLALQEEKGFSDKEIYDGIENASALGYILMRNSSVSGAEAGCQAEVGAASAMAASALVELMGGTVDMCFQAAGIALANLLGMVCDPICGLVEAPCQSRNAVGVANAISSAEMALAGIKNAVVFDEMAEVLLNVGKSLPATLRETAMGGMAVAPSACQLCNQQ
ncbi:MAG: L-serine ammonia-lyase, iron-sulfur-dependent, subunit alpha [Lachnospiraceae bacterium]|nr:L-serine ammonia-lyase, iron-sulfur-dependent, subunit alpha [Lachnospiraceae bacterium]